MATVWWVNQGKKYHEERAGGYVWAPTKNKAGVAADHHVNVSRLTVGDAVVHYANGSIRAIGIVLEKGGVHQRPSELPTEVWEQEGYLARVTYHDLVNPIALTELPPRPPDAGPFDRNGSVKQGYLYPLSPEFAATLYDTFADRWPIAWLPRAKARSVWLFQANPGQWDVEVEVPRIGVGGDDQWTVSRHGADMRSGDVVVLWKSGARAGVYGLAEIRGPLTTRVRPEFRRQSPEDSESEPVIPIRYTRYPTTPILRSGLLPHPILGTMAVIRAPQGTNFRLSAEEWRALQELIGMNWDEFIYWARRIKEWPGFDADERDYKLRLANQLANVRHSFGTGGDAWLPPLENAIRSDDNNFTNWRFNQPFLAWTRDHAEEARAALTCLWDGREPSAADLTAFAVAVPAVLKGGTSTTITMASMLLMAVDVLRFPPYRFKAFAKVYELVGYDRPAPDADQGTVWDHAMTFLSRLVQEAAERGLILRDRLDAQSLVWAISRKFEVDTWTDADRRRYRAFLGGTSADLDEDAEEPDALAELAGELYLDVEYLRRIETLLKDKRQVIFYGPPGTGKTYVAKRLAEYFARGGGSVEKVQFHPSYAYEDFVEGFRPQLDAGQAAFRLTPGPLRRIAKAAEAAHDATCLLLIDEINRGNVAKVFGELYYLLEYRDEELSLLYSAEKAKLPRNLWIIGTMNTADRSIALVDAALRRRFHFVPFYPDKPPVAGLLARWLADNKPELLWLAEVVDRANKELGNNHTAIGPSHFLRPDLTEDWVKLIWEHSVLPYIEEQFFGDETRLAAFALDKLRAASSPSGTAE